MSFSVTFIQRFFSNYQAISKFYIAFSGGLDSTVLLHTMHATELPIHAVYVNHHLQKENDDWQHHCGQQCERWNIPFTVLHAEIKQQPRQSLEELARNARYELLTGLLGLNDALVTAHHQDDVAETILLQLLRGAGPQGLAGMPECKQLKMGLLLRPLLTISRKQINDYASEHHLDWIEDPSNQDNHFDRNFLRNDVIPKLCSRWPSAQQSIARSAQLHAEVSNCLNELADIDLQQASTEQTKILNIAALQVLSRERLSNVLRYWIRAHQMRVPSRKILQHVIKDIVEKQEIETSPMQSWKEGEIRRYQNQLYLLQPLSPHDPYQEICWKIDQPLYIESLGRTLMPEELNAMVLPTEVKELMVRFRQGGERLKPIGQKQHRSLKKLLNDAEVPPWMRDRIPLLYHGDVLISVLGYWNTAQVCENTA
ncbi:MAG: tRNA lysidine(34) synthetase TilS [Pseudomonadota bacterium]